MQKEILLQMVEQSRSDCAYAVNKINDENVKFRLTEQTASTGFIYRHIGETTHLICQFFGYPTTVEGTTIGKKDLGQIFDLATSKQIFEAGYQTVEKIIHDTTDEEWLAEIDTTWFGKITRIRALSILLFHNAHHCGQIASALVKGK